MEDAEKNIPYSCCFSIGYREFLPESLKTGEEKSI
jgi:hypothetical protein